MAASTIKRRPYVRTIKISELLDPLEKMKMTEQGIIPSRGGGPSKGADYYGDLKRSLPEPDPYGEQASRFEDRPVREPPQSLGANPGVNSMFSERSSGGDPYAGLHQGEGLMPSGDTSVAVIKGPDGWYWRMNTPDADPIGPFPTSRAAYENSRSRR